MDNLVPNHLEFDIRAGVVVDLIGVIRIRIIAEIVNFSMVNFPTLNISKNAVLHEKKIRN